MFKAFFQPELGKPLKRCFALPNDEFTYGRPNLPLDGGAAEAMTIREPIRQIRKKEKAKERDFIALNKGAVATGLVTAKVNITRTVSNAIWSNEMYVK